MKTTLITEITSRTTPAAGLEDLADLVIPNVPASGPTPISVWTGTTLLSEDKYYGDADNQVHLDLRDLVRENTLLLVPGLQTNGTTVTGADSFRKESTGSVYLRIEVALTGQLSPTTYFFRAFPYDYFPSRIDVDTDYVAPIDALRVPADYLLPLSAFYPSQTAYESRLAGDIRYISAKRNIQLTPDAAISGAMDDGMVSQLVPLNLLPFSLDEPFFLQLSYEDGENTHIFTTPVFTPVREEMEQYAFLNAYGIYDNIPMSGTLTDMPEIELETLRRTGGFERISGRSSDLHEQNSGPLTYQAARALASYMLSDMVFHYDSNRNTWRQIVIETPSISIPRRSGVYNITFTWRYADNNEIDIN